MTFLNDTQIRSLSLVPTHKWKGGFKHYYRKEDDCGYDLEDGTSIDLSFFNDDGVIACSEDEIGDRMITPFVPKQVRVSDSGVPIVSYGTSSMGYDVRLGRKFKIFTNVFNALIDPLNMPETAYVDYEGDYVIIPPNSYVLGHTIEYFKLPRYVGAICVGKSTYARVGCAINVTPIEPGFHGQVVIEIANQTPLPMKVYADQGIAQFVFLKGNPCEVSYADRGGKYQNQTGIQTALV